MKNKVWIILIIATFNNLSVAQLLGGTLKSTISPYNLSQNRYYLIVSVYDQDYLPYVAPTVAATTTPLAAGGSNEAITVNYQGTITTTEFSVKIPIVATSSGTLPAYSTTITIPASLTQDGISRDVTFSWIAQAYTTASTSISATIKAIGGTLNIKKLDINSGLGNDSLGILLGEFPYPYNKFGSIAKYQLRVIPGIPDKMFGKADNGGSTTTHLMLYAPVMAEDGNIWLSNNLGAHYANINHANFNFMQQATSISDHLAYGSLFQWGRKPDGHELINWTSTITGTAVYSTTSINSNVPLTPYFILEPNSPYDWRVNQDDTLWELESSLNNPCPTGFRISTINEMNNLFSMGLISNSVKAFNSTLKLTASGMKFYSLDTLFDTELYGYYWTNTANAIHANARIFYDLDAYYTGYARAYGFSARCIKN